MFAGQDYNALLVKRSVPCDNQTIALAALAILGHKSAHSFPMGPVMAEPEKIARKLSEIPVLFV